MKHQVEVYAKVFNCHIKTILRAATGQPHPSDWHPDPLDHTKVADAFGMKRALLEQAIAKKDELITVEQAAEVLEISVRRFHQRREAGDKDYVPAAAHGRIVRYSRAHIENLHADI